MRERLHAWLPDVQRWFEEALEGRETDPEATADRLRMIGDVTALSVLAGQLQYDPMVPRRERRLAFAIQQGMLRLIPRSEEHTSELQSLMRISYAVFCLKKKQ